METTPRSRIIKDNIYIAIRADTREQSISHLEEAHREIESMERELTAVTEQRDGLQKIIDEQCRVSSVCREYREQRDRLAEALRKDARMHF